MYLLLNKNLGSLYAISSGLCYGLLGYFGTTLLNTGLSVYNMLFWRFFIAALFMLITLIPNCKTIFNLPFEGFKVLIYGIIFYSTNSIFYFIASKHIGTGLAMVIFFTYPAMVMLFNFVFYKVKISKTYYLAFSMIVIGMIFIADLQCGTLDILGIGLSLISSVFYSGYIIASKQNKTSLKLSTLMVSVGSMVTCFMVAYLDNSFFIPSTMYQWSNIVGLGLICTAIPILLLLRALKFISSNKASILSVLEPVLIVIFGTILLDEKINYMQITGVVVVLSGTILTLLNKETKVKNV